MMKHSTASVHDGANGPVLGALCALKQLTEREPPEVSTGNSCDAEKKRVASAQYVSQRQPWRGKFLKDDSSEIQLSDKANHDPAASEHWKKQWPTWTAPAKHLDTDSKGTKKIENGFSEKISPEVKAVTRTKLKVLLEAYAACEATTTTGTPAPAPATIKAKLNEALYGAASGKDCFEKDGACHGAGKVDKCEAERTIKSKQLLAYAMMCVTLAQKSQGGVKSTALQTPPPQWSATDTNCGTDPTKVEKLFQADTKVKLSGEALRTAIHKIATSIYVNNRIGYLGYTATAPKQPASVSNTTIRSKTNSSNSTS
uniref:Variant surface glycoprotein n=1 Tax=Trypanosoma brucei TaxID=5691 RepID=A0A1V0FZM5_9TRYP|nr:variant surface glycoprotein [Trypanosoma brucei]